MVDIATDASVKPASHPEAPCVWDWTSVPPPSRPWCLISPIPWETPSSPITDATTPTCVPPWPACWSTSTRSLWTSDAGDEPIRLSITGSGGLALADNLHVPFIQEVIAETEAIDKEYPQADVIIELGGEDAKITYLKPTPEQRMNGSCAGGTGAFIDQMSTLLDTDAAGLNEMAKSYENLYPIASRCGVFAKTDLQPLINDGAAKPDLAASIFTAVATQTIAGLASGRPIHGTVIFLGGPLFFMSELRAAFPARA